MGDNYDISNVSFDITPRINNISKSYIFCGNKKNGRSRNLKSLSNEKTRETLNKKKVTFIKIEIIRIESYKKYNKTIKNKIHFDESNNKCFIF
jgi:hypothetical protein